ncbi:hypothetical protein ACNR9Q_12925 [Maribacter sp. X9]|uniref:hypothetical protein n=1 Tax=Maribacter sp. X9 TaxID=3402159 RepID=UPI003AF3A8DB
MRILIVDDSIDKISELTKLISVSNPEAHIETAESISNAITLFQSEPTYNLAIIDIFLPLRIGEDPLKIGGELLIKEMYRKKKNLNIPNFIIGFSQYDTSNAQFSSIWKIVKFEPNSMVWKESFKELLDHIKTSKFTVNQEESIKPTVYVEGLTDVNYLNQAFEIFFPKERELIEIKSQKNAGANWVANQVAIWAISKRRDKKGAYIKSVGLLDSDEAGIKAKKDLVDRIQTENEQKCFKIVHINQDHNQELINFYSKGCKLEVEIESLFSIDVLEHADSKGWLEYRGSTFVERPKGWKQHEENSVDYVLKQGITKEQSIYLKKVKTTSKQDFCKYIIKEKDKKSTFSNFEGLLKKILENIT